VLDLTDLRGRPGPDRCHQPGRGWGGSAAGRHEARETLGGAVGLAGQVGGVEGQRLRDAAATAFVHGSAVASMVAVGVLVAVAATVVVGLRRR
jgi:DHA2 family multidrug resistance protein-like MFS transporter